MLQNLTHKANWLAGGYRKLLPVLMEMLKHFRYSFKNLIFQNTDRCKPFSVNSNGFLCLFFRKTIKFHKAVL